MDIDIPGIHAEVAAAFAAYERALVTNDVATLQALFHRDPRTLRYGPAKTLLGWDAIAAFRAGRSPAGLERTLENTIITTYGRDFATASTEFRRAGRHGRQSQSWVRFPEDDWRIVAAPCERPAMTARPPLPPFDAETAARKARGAEDAWNSREPERIALAYTEDSRWRNRAEFFAGRPAIIEFLRRKWAGELDYRLIKEVWAWHADRIAVRFVYEWHDAAGQWFRSHGNENWAFDAQGLMRERHASINDVPIAETDRRFHWPASGPRPADHPGLAGLGL